MGSGEYVKNRILELLPEKCLPKRLRYKSKWIAERYMYRHLPKGIWIRNAKKYKDKELPKGIRIINKDNKWLLESVNNRTLEKE